MVDTENQRFLVQSHGQAADLAQLAASVIDRQGATPLTLGAVAAIAAGSPPPIGAALIGQKPGLLLIISSEYGANTLQVASGLRQALARLAPALAHAGVDLDAHALEPTTFIFEALRDLRNSLLIGAGLILVVIVGALRNWRVALISFATIPLALLLAILVLDRFGFTLNAFSLGGLAIALGIIVDDAIIDIENIRRRLHANEALPQPAPRLRVILDASLEVRTPIIFATLAIIVIFLPVFALTGVAGRLFAPLGDCRHRRDPGVPGARRDLDPGIGGIAAGQGRDRARGSALGQKDPAVPSALADRRTASPRDSGARRVRRTRARLRSSASRSCRRGFCRASTRTT